MPPTRVLRPVAPSLAAASLLRSNAPLRALAREEASGAAHGGAQPKLRLSALGYRRMLQLGLSCSLGGEPWHARALLDVLAQTHVPGAMHGEQVQMARELARLAAEEA